MSCGGLNRPGHTHTAREKNGMIPHHQESKTCHDGTIQNVLYAYIDFLSEGI
jgi:hypothetical protein